MRGLPAIAALLLLAASPVHAKSVCDDAQDQNTMGLDDRSRDLLKKAQRAWIAFRDSECTYQNAANEGGSIYPLVYNGCLTKLTKDRTVQLKQGQN